MSICYIERAKCFHGKHKQTYFSSEVVFFCAIKTVHVIDLAYMFAIDDRHS